MKVCIVTEGGRKSGFGHITRCASLYQAFNEIEIIPQFIVNGDETVQNLLKDINHERFDWIADQRKLLATLRDADIVFVDSYQAGRDLYNKISNQVKTAVYLDDNMRLNYPKGIILNGAVFAERMPYPKRTDVTYLLGAQYASLRKEFRDVPAKSIRDNIETVMITFGGMDIHNLTPKVLKLLVDIRPELLKNVIIAKGFQNITEIEELKDNNTKLFYYPNAAEMKKVMLESDIAISASGQTLYELASVGTPVISIAVIENQLTNAEHCQEAGIVYYAGVWSDSHLLESVETLIQKLENRSLREKLIQKGRDVVDGKGCLRVVDFLLDKMKREQDTNNDTDRMVYYG